LPNISARQGERFISRKNAAHSMIENRYPMHERGPPRKLSILPQTPGILDAASGTASQRSGLCSRQLSEPSKDRENTNRNCIASSPQRDLALFIANIGNINVSPFLIL
jgi:hypothetical protein